MPLIRMMIACMTVGDITDKNMKRIYLALTFGFIFSIGKILAQERVVDNSEVQSLLMLSQSIQSGEISLLINSHRKGKSEIETKEYKVIFSKTGKIGKHSQIEFNYNILSIKDSMQYIYNGQTWCIINHKKKICTMDTAVYKKRCVCLPVPPYDFTSPDFDVLCNEMFRFYASGNLRSLFLEKAIVIVDTQKTENTKFLKAERNYFVHNGRKANKPISWISEFEWDINKSTLLRCSKIVTDYAKYSKKTIEKREAFLTSASLNQEKYADVELYNGLNYAKSYKVRYKSIANWRY